MTGYKFRKGDVVVRVAGAHNGMRVGDKATVVEVSGGGLTLDAFQPNRSEHDPVNFDLYGIRASADIVNSPSHYLANGIEAIDVIEAFLTPDEARGYRKGNAIKYLLRSGRKDDIATDLKKLRWYVERELAKHEGASE